jgi:RNA polymerase sigma-B factor
LRAYKNDGDIRARDRLVALYLPLVEAFAQRYSRPGAERDDLVQAGSIGLLNAIERFDPQRGDELAAFAVPTVVGEMKRHIRDRTAAIKLPRRLQEAQAALPQAREKLTAQLEREPTDDELAAALGLDPLELQRLRDPAAGDGVADLAAEPKELELSDERLMLAGAFRALDDTERSIVYLRYVRDLGQADVAGQLGMSERQLARRTRSALAKLRGEIERGGSPRAGPPTRGGPAPPASSTASAPAAPTHTAPGPAAASTPASAPAAADGPPSEAPGRKGAHSGRLLLRMPQSLHAELARAAEREDVSLNQFITNSLAAAVGWRQPEGDAEDPPASEHAPAEPENAPPRWLRAALVTNVIVVGIAAIVAVVLLLVAWQQGF